MKYPEKVERRPDRIAAVRYPEKVEHRPDRIAAVRHPEKVGCRSDGIAAVRHPDKVGCWPDGMAAVRHPKNKLNISTKSLSFPYLFIIADWKTTFLLIGISSNNSRASQFALNVYTLNWWNSEKPYL